MYAIHQTLLPSSAINFTLFLQHFTPSTIYPIPIPSSSRVQLEDVQVVGNLVVAGGADLRVFEVRESKVPVIDGAHDGEAEEGVKGEYGDSYLDSGPAKRALLTYTTRRSLHLVASHQVHGTITGLAPLRTIESAVDGLDRLLVSFKDAKMAILEWVGGDIATVSLHTYERAIQMTTGDIGAYEPLLRSDPLSRLAVLTLPDDALAVLPLLQDLTELDPLDSYPRDLPYSPSYVLSLADQFSIKNLRDFTFLPGFNTPTLAMLFSPHQTWAGRYGASRDTFQLEIRTFDVAAGYPLLTSVKGLPADCLYMVTAPTDIGGVVIITETGIIHVDQAGRIAASSVSGWWRHVTMLRADTRGDHMKLSLLGSKAAFVEKELVLVQADGSAYQVKLEMDGRAVGAITVQPKMATLPPPASISVLGQAMFVGCAEGDSVLYNVDLVRDSAKEEVKPDTEMDADDDDLYADANPIQNGLAQTGPASVHLHTGDTLSGIGKIIDMEFGIASTDQGLRTYPQLVAISGGTRQSTFNVFRRGIPINKRRRFNELATADRVWFLPIQRLGGHGPMLRGVRDEERTTVLLSSEGTQTRVFALSHKANPEQIGRLPTPTINAAPFFHRSMILHVSADGVSLLDSNGKSSQQVWTVGDDDRIVSASICDPYVSVRFSSGNWLLFEGDYEAKAISQKHIHEPSHVQAVEVFEDITGIYRTFDPSTVVQHNADDLYSSSASHADGASKANGTFSMPKKHTPASLVSSSAQIKQLVASEPAISSTIPSTDAALHTGRGSLWLATLSADGQLAVRSLPDAEIVFESQVGLGDSVPSFEDDYGSKQAAGQEPVSASMPHTGDGKRRKGKGKQKQTGQDGQDVEMEQDIQDVTNEENDEEDDEEQDDEMDEVEQMMFHSLGKGDTARPHLFVLHKSGRLNVYAALPRFTLSPPASSTPSSSAHPPTRRALAVRFKKVHTQLLPTSSGAGSTTVNAHGPGSGKLPYTLHPFSDLEGLTGVFVTGEKPQWIVGDEKYDVRSYGLKQAAWSFGRTTHLGGRGEYFIRIEDGTFICYLPPTLNTDFAMPCDRYEMERVYTNLAFDPPSAHYVGATALTVPFQAYDEEGEILLGPEGETLNPATNERSSLELFSQGEDPWRVIDGYDFDQYEVVLALESVKLESDSMPGGFRDFIAVGTGFDFAEDRATRGNTYIFEIVQTVPLDPSNPKASGWRLKLRTKDPARNPVSAIANMHGYLLNSNGPKMYAKGLDRDERLMGLAFLDINQYATSIKTFKNFALVGDLTKSMWLISFQEHPYKLLAISKDLQEVHTVTSDFLVHDGQVAFLSTDRFGNMRMLDFDPADPDSYNGERLMLRTEYHMGSPVTACKTVARRRAAEEEYAPQTQLIYATADGALTTVVSVKPARFKRLQLVAEQLTRNARHVAGMNPKAYRTVRNDLLSKPLNKGILDGQLLQHFALQPVHRQRQMMRQIGTDEVTVASDLQALGGFW